MDTRVGVVSILVSEADSDTVSRINELLSEHGEIVIGRLGVPYREKNLKVMALIVDGTTDQVGALTGRLGSLSGVTTKSSLLTK